MITSDHGEAFKEHGRVGHAYSLYQEEIHVPLIIYDSEKRARRLVNEPIAGSALAPWLLARLGLTAPPIKQAQIRTEAGGIAALFGANSAINRVGAMDHLVMRQGVFKLMSTSRGDEPLFDFARDPMESSNIFSQQPEVALRA